MHILYLIVLNICPTLFLMTHACFLLDNMVYYYQFIIYTIIIVGDTVNKLKVLFIASTGGHLSELLQLKPLFSEYDFHLVTERTKSTENFKNEYKSKVDFLVYGTKSHLLAYMIKFPFNIIKSLCIFLKVRPTVVVTTGTHTAVPMCYIAKLFRKKVIFIETFANSTTPTSSGKMVYPIADKFIVQWEGLLEYYPNAIYGGWIY